MPTADVNRVVFAVDKHDCIILHGVYLTFMCTLRCYYAPLIRCNSVRRSFLCLLVCQGDVLGET